MNYSAEQIIARALDAAGEAGGYDEVRAIAERGPGAMTFSEEAMTVLTEAYGSAGDALYAIQLEAQRRISLIDSSRR